MKKSRSKFLKIVDEKHDINFHWPYLKAMYAFAKFLLVDFAPNPGVQIAYAI
jgi:hypothetical protein